MWWSQVIFRVLLRAQAYEHALGIITAQWNTFTPDDADAAVPKVPLLAVGSYDNVARVLNGLTMSSIAEFTAPAGVVDGKSIVSCVLLAAWRWPSHIVMVACSPTTCAQVTYVEVVEDYDAAIGAVDDSTLRETSNIAAAASSKPAVSKPTGRGVKPTAPRAFTKGNVSLASAGTAATKQSVIDRPSHVEICAGKVALAAASAVPKDSPLPCVGPAAMRWSHNSGLLVSLLHPQIE